MVAETYVLLGDKDQAFHWLERAYSEHDDEMVTLKIDTVWDNYAPTQGLRTCCDGWA
jgi:hypothetical protein